MGVEYRHFLIPRDNTVRPDGDAVRRLIEAWRTHGFIAPSGPQALVKFKTNHTGTTIEPEKLAHAATTGALIDERGGWRAFADEMDQLLVGEAIVQWPITNTNECGIAHPLGLVDRVAGTYFDLELHFSDDFVEHCSEMIEPIDASCACGAQLAYNCDVEEQYDIFYDGRIRRTCSECGAAFRPQEHAVVYRDGVTGAEREVMGGAIYRFAIVVDCGKCWQLRRDLREVSLAATKEFIDVSSEALGAPLYEIGSFY
jgi:hypothetical protein